MNTYKVTFAARFGSSTTLVRSARTIAEVTASFARWVALGWILTVERIV